ncbi:hypothetical protein ACFLSQ_10305, partial [Bacteroidota bacterium]
MSIIIWDINKGRRIANVNNFFAFPITQEYYNSYQAMFVDPPWFYFQKGLFYSKNSKLSYFVPIYFDK